MIEGSGSGSIPLTYRSGSRSKRAQKHTSPTDPDLDPDPQQWLNPFFYILCTCRSWEQHIRYGTLRHFKPATAAVPKPLPNPDVGGEDSNFINYRILCVFCTDNYTFSGYLFFSDHQSICTELLSVCAVSPVILGFVVKFNVLIRRYSGQKFLFRYLLSHCMKNSTVLVGRCTN